MTETRFDKSTYFSDGFVHLNHLSKTTFRRGWHDRFEFFVLRFPTGPDMFSVYFDLAYLSEIRINTPK